MEPQPDAPVVTPVEAAPAAPPPVPPRPDAATPPRPDPYAPPAPGYSAPGYGYQPPANPPTSPYLQPGEAGYGAQPTYAPPVYAQAPYGYPPQAPKGLSITSMVLGLAGLLLGPLLSVAAVITGHIAAKREPHGKGFWLTGIISGYVLIAFWFVIILFWIVLLAVYPNAA